VAIGGTILTISGVMYILVCVMTAFFSRPLKEAPGPLQFAEAQAGPEHAPAALDQWRPWVAAAIVLILIAYGPTLLELLGTTGFNAPGRRVW
jgi:cytochrome c oxidase subunit I